MFLLLEIRKVSLSAVEQGVLNVNLRINSMKYGVWTKISICWVEFAHAKNSSTFSLRLIKIILPMLRHSSIKFAFFIIIIVFFVFLFDLSNIIEFLQPTLHREWKLNGMRKKCTCNLFQQEFLLNTIENTTWHDRMEKEKKNNLQNRTLLRPWCAWLIHALFYIKWTTPLFIIHLSDFKHHCQTRREHGFITCSTKRLFKWFYHKQSFDGFLPLRFGQCFSSSWNSIKCHFLFYSNGTCDSLGMWSEFYSMIEPSKWNYSFGNIKMFCDILCANSMADTNLYKYFIYLL